MSASCSLIRLASPQASGPFASLAESGSDKTDAEIPFASMSDKDCSIDQGGSLSIGACDPRFVMMWEWTSMMPVIFRAEGVDRLSFFCTFDIALDLLEAVNAGWQHTAHSS